METWYYEIVSMHYIRFVKGTDVLSANLPENYVLNLYGDRKCWRVKYVSGS